MLLETTMLVFSLIGLVALLHEMASERGLILPRSASVSGGISSAAIALSLALRLIQDGSTWSEPRKVVVTLAIGTLSACSIFLWRSVRNQDAARPK